MLIGPEVFLCHYASFSGCAYLIVVIRPILFTIFLRL